MNHVLFGVLASILILISEGMYIWTIFVPDPLTKSVTKPSRSTYWIWAAVQIMIASLYYQQGGGSAVGISIALSVSFLLVALLSIKYGYATWTKVETICLLLLGVGIGLYFFAQSLFVAFLVCMAADIVGVASMVPRVWKAPKTESMTAWIIAVLAALINLNAVEDWTSADIAYQVVNCIVNGGVLLLLILRNKSTSAKK